MIKLIKSTFYDEAATKKKLTAFIESATILSMGEQCFRFEKAFAKKQARPDAVFVSSGSAANLVLIQALLNLGRLKPGDKVGFSALTWATNIMPLIQLGLTPVAIDCEIATLNVSPATLKTHLGGLNALFLTNVLGFADDLPTIQKLCAEHKVLLLEDNCESLGSKINGTLLGNFSLASTFSFFVGHHMSTIEGGMITTDDRKLAAMLRMVRAHGWDRNLPAAQQANLRHQHKIDNFFAKYTFYDLAYNARPNEINGFLGNIQLGFLAKIVNKRATNFQRFKTAVKTNKDFLPLETSHMELVSNFAMPIICRDEKLLTKYLKRFTAAEVEIRPIIAGDMTQQPFYQKYIKQPTACPNAAFVHRHGFYFGNNPDMTEAEIEVLVRLCKPDA